MCLTCAQKFTLACEGGLSLQVATSAGAEGTSGSIELTLNDGFDEYKKTIVDVGSEISPLLADCAHLAEVTFALHHM